MDNPLKHTAIDIFDYSGNKVCNLYDSSLSAEGQAYDIVFTNPLGSFPTLTFSMPYVIDDRKNFRWAFIKPEYLIYFRSGTYGDWFVLDIPIHKKNDKSITKEVSCSHIASILKTKNLYMTFDDETGIGNLPYLMNRALKGTLWTFDEEGSDQFLEKDNQTVKVRSFSSDGKEGALQLVTNICTLFNAYPIFDGNTKTITVKALNNKGDIREMYIGKDLTALEVKHDSTSLITRMYVEGSYGDGEFITIDSVNPTGLSYIMDFSYYKELGLFTAEHQAALDKYIHDMNEAVGNVRSVTEELLQREQELSELWGQIDFVYYPIVNGEIDYDNYILGGNATEKDAQISEWDSTVTYNYGDIVFYQGNAYQARVTITPGAVPTDPAYWKEVELHYTILQDNHEYRDQTNTDGITLHDLAIVRFILLPSSTIGGKQVSVESNLQTITTIQEDRAREMNLPNPDMGKVATYDSQIRAYQNRNTELYTGIGTVEFGVMYTGSLDEAHNGKEKTQANAIRSDVLTPVRDVTYSMSADANRKLSIFRFDNTSTLITPVLTVENNTSVSIDTDAFDNTQYYRVIIERTDSAETAPVATDATVTITHTDGLYSLMERAFNLIVRIDQLSKQRTSSLDSQDEIEVEFATAMGDMLKEGYWNNENYVEGQEQALYDDATEVMDYMCRPDVTYTVSRVSLAGQLGYPTEDLQNNMQVRLYDKELGVNDLVYISKVIEYPDDESKDEVELSNKPISLTGLTLDSVLSRMADLANMLQQKNAVYKRAEAINADGSIYMDRLEGQINIMTNRILSSKSSWYTDDNGNIIFQSADGKSAMMLSGDGWMIANGKRQDGTWNWRTAANGTGLTADVITAGFLSADRIAARSITANQLASDVGASLDLSSNLTITSTVTDIIKDRLGYVVNIASSNGNFISETVPETTLSPVIYYGGENVTVSVPVTDMTWTRDTGDTAADTAWNEAWLANRTKEITVDAEDVSGKAKFILDVLVEPTRHVLQTVSISDISAMATVELYLTANQPTIQNYNPNLGGGYTPNWAESPYLTVTPSIYINGTEMHPSSALTVVWKRKAGTAGETNLVSGESVASATGVLTATQNFLGNIASGNLSYICYVTYTNPTSGTTSTAREEVSFALARAAMNVQSVKITGAQAFKVDDEGTVSPASITLTAVVSNTTISNWQYKDSAGNWQTYPNSGSATTLTVLPTDAVFVNDVATIRVNTASGLDDVYSVYKVVDGSIGRDGLPACTVFLTNENITFPANQNGQITGMSTSGAIVAYKGNEAVTPSHGEVSGLPDGQEMDFQWGVPQADHSFPYTITIANGATLGGAGQQGGTISIPITKPIQATLYITWSKVNTGLTGNGVETETILYAASTNGDTPPATGSSAWKSTIAETGVQSGQYLWTRTVITYTTGSSSPIYSVSRIGEKGEQGSTGRGISQITPYYLKNDSDSTYPDPVEHPTSWDTDPPALDPINRFLWSYEVIYYTSGTPASEATTPRVIGVYGQKGDKGDTGSSGLTYGITANQGIVFTSETESLSFTAYTYADGADVFSNATEVVWDIWYNDAYTVVGSNVQTVTLTRAQLDGYDGGCLLRLRFKYNNVLYVANETIIDKTDNYQAVIISSGGNVFYDGAGTSTLTCKLYQNGVEKDADGSLFAYRWTRLDKNGTPKEQTFKTGKSIEVNAYNVGDFTTFVCYATYTDGAGENLLDLSTFVDWTNTARNVEITFDKVNSTVRIVGNPSSTHFTSSLLNGDRAFLTLPAGTYIMDGDKFVSLSYRSGSTTVTHGSVFTIDADTTYTNILATLTAGKAMDTTYPLVLRKVGDTYSTQAQFTITSETSITASDTAPENPQLNQLWLDTSDASVNVLKRWNGTDWVETTLSQDMLNNIQQSITSYGTQIQQLNNSISQTVTRTTYEADMSGKADTSWVETRVQSVVTQTENAITNVFSQSTSYTDSVVGEYEQLKKDVYSWQRFDSNGLTLGKTDQSGAESPFKVQLTNTELSFLENNDPVAYLNNLALYITNARVTNTLSVGIETGDDAGWFDWTMTKAGLGMKWKSA